MYLRPLNFINEILVSDMLSIHKNVTHLKWYMENLESVLRNIVKLPGYACFKITSVLNAPFKCEISCTKKKGKNNHDSS